ncbi:MAG: thioredoxin [Cyanobacteria bacterium P01_H01_bin.121]
MSTVAYIQDEQEFDTLLANEKVFVVDCTATWCGPCRVVAPLMDRLAADYPEQIKVLKLDLEDNRPLALRFNIKSIPAIMFFKDGKLVETLIGVKPYETFTEAVDKLL